MYATFAKWLSSVVEFASSSDMKSALDKLDGSELNGRRIKLIEDRKRRRYVMSVQRINNDLKRTLLFECSTNITVPKLPVSQMMIECPLFLLL